MFKNIFEETDIPIACDEDGLTAEIVALKKYSKGLLNSIDESRDQKKKREGDRTHEQHRDKEE